MNKHRYEPTSLRDKIIAVLIILVIVGGAVWFYAAFAPLFPR